MDENEFPSDFSIKSRPKVTLSMGSKFNSNAIGLDACINYRNNENVFKIQNSDDDYRQGVDGNGSNNIPSIRIDNNTHPQQLHQGYQKSLPLLPPISPLQSDLPLKPIKFVNAQNAEIKEFPSSFEKGSNSPTILGSINIQNNFSRNSQNGQGQHGQISPPFKDDNDNSSSSSSSSSSSNSKHQSSNNINNNSNNNAISNCSIRNINPLPNSNNNNTNIGNTINSLINNSVNSNTNNNNELLIISDDEMLNFPKHFTDAFNIGDYDGVSKVWKHDIIRLSYIFSSKFFIYT